MDATAILWFVVGLGLLVGGAELLVRGAARLAAAFGIAPLVIGLTVVAFGTSAPELAVSVQGTLMGTSDIAVGNIVGSNICNILLILGIAALIAPVAVQKSLVKLDIPLVIVASVAVWLASLSGVVDQWEGALLFACLVAYLIYALRSGRKPDAPDDTPAVAADVDDLIPQDGEINRWWSGALVAIGLGMLVLGSELMVDGAVDMARALGVSDLVISLTVISIGTSLPEVAATVVASIRGERDMAVGNVFGSNLFNLLGVLGLTAAVAPGGVAVSDAALNFDIPVMVFVAVACLPVLVSGWSIDRWEGGVFVAYYVAFVIFVVLKATEHDALPVFSDVMIGFVLPLTALTLLVVAINAHRQRRAARANE